MRLVVSPWAVLLLTTGLSVGIASAQESRTNQVYLRSYSLNVPRRGHTVSTLPDNRVAIAGGMNQAGSVGEIEILDSAEATLTVAAHLGVPRTAHSATLLRDGTLMLIGGSNAGRLLNSTEIFDPRTNVLTPGPDMNHARAGHSATRLEDGRILVAGGRSDDSAEIFDPSTGRFTLLAAKLTAARALHSAVLLKNGDVLLAGGIGQDGAAVDTAEIFGKTTLSFSSIRGWMQKRRIQPELNLMPDGKVQVIGGDSERSIEMYDPEVGYFRAGVRLLPTADSVAGLALLGASTRAGLMEGVKPAPAADASGGYSTPSGDSREVSQFHAALDAMFRRKASGADPGGASAKGGSSYPQADYTSTEIPGRNEVLVSASSREESSLTESVILLPPALPVHGERGPHRIPPRPEARCSPERAGSPTRRSC